MTLRITKYDSIRQKLLFVAVIPTLVTSLLLGGYFTSTRINDVHDNLAKKGNLIASNLSPSVEFGLFSRDIRFLKSLFVPLLNGNDVVSILVLDQSRNVVVASISPEYSASQLLMDEREISVFESAVYSSHFDASELLEFEQLHEKENPAPDVKLMGWVVVKLSTYSAEKRQYEIIENALIFIFLGVLISGFIAYRMSKNIAKPILSLTNMVHGISNGDLSLRSKEKAVGELDLLQKGINSMAETIQGAQLKLEGRVSQATEELTETVTKLEKKNTALNKTQADLLLANAAKTEFLAKMSHEIRTPLMTVIGFSRLIEKANGKEDVESYTRLINRSGAQLLNIIDDILSFSKLEDEHVTLNNEDVNIRDVIDDVISMLSSAAKTKRIALFAQVSSEIPTYLKGDGAKLSQIVINLLSNAIKFTESGHVRVEASLINFFGDKVVVEFGVIDTGVGVSAEDAEKIFGSFFQAESDRKRAYEGTGLGLAISKKLVGLMGGEIGADTSLTSGARFWFSVPMQLSEKEETANIFQPLKKTIVLYDKGDVSSQSLSKLLLSWKADLYIAETTNKMLNLISSPTALSATLAVPVDTVIISLDFFESTESNVMSLIKATDNRFSGNVVFLVSHMADVFRQKIPDDSRVVILESPVSRQHLYAALNGGIKSEKKLQKALIPPLNSAQDTSSQKKELTQAYQQNKASHRTARILVAEDNKFNAILIGELLSERGIESIRVNNADAALKQLQHEKYDLLLLDVHMPGMDGLTLASHIRQHCCISKETPIIAFTADIYVRKNAQLHDGGINDVLYKPLTDASLDDILTHWLPGYCVSINKREDKSHLMPAKVTQRLLGDVLDHLNNIETSYNVNDDVAMAGYFHQLEGVLGYFKFDDVQVKLKVLKVYALSRQDGKFRDALLQLTKLASLEVDQA